MRAWAFLKYYDVYGVLRDHDTFFVDSRQRGVRPGDRFCCSRMTRRHSRFRRLVNKASTMRRVEALTPLIASIANELPDEIRSREVEIDGRYTFRCR
jgi:cytochrome P450